jgi:hypothetical protein
MTDGHAELAEGADALAHIVQGDTLRCTNNDRACRCRMSSSANQTESRRTVDVYELSESEWNIASTRWHVHHENIKSSPRRCNASRQRSAPLDRAVLTARSSTSAPVDVEQELLNGLLDHEPAPDNGRILPTVVVVIGPAARLGFCRCRFGKEKAHGHARYAVVRERDERTSCGHREHCVCTTNGTDAHRP